VLIDEQLAVGASGYVTLRRTAVHIAPPPPLPVVTVGPSSAPARSRATDAATAR
jgi:hypothetical protein